MQQDNKFLMCLGISGLMHGILLYACVGMFMPRTFEHAGTDEGLVTIMLVNTLADKQPAPEQEIIDDSVFSSLNRENMVVHQLSAVSHCENAAEGGGNEYFAALREKIIRSKQYPKQAQRLRICGENKVFFNINPDGCISDIRLIDSSGYLLLDDETCAAVRRASPFPPIPSDMPVRPLEMTVTLKYKI